jgi:hypothetical protein
VPEWQKAEAPEANVATGPTGPANPPVVTSAIITKNQEYDKTMGPWELDKEAQAIRRRKVMVANAIQGRPVMPYGVGDTIAFSCKSSFDTGEIVDITKTAYVVKTAAGQIEVAHEAAFEPTIKDIF